MSGVLVTGARGFAGSHLLELLSRSGVQAAGWGRPTGEKASRSLPTARVDEIDLLDRAAVFNAIAELRPGAVYHLAGAAHVGDAFRNVTDTLAANVLCTHHLLDALQSAGVKARVLISGSSLVYRQSDRALSEDDPAGPATPYGLSKLAQEMLGQRAILEDGQEVLLTRSFNHTGPRQDPTYAAPAFARQIALIEKGRIAPEIIVGNLEASRDLHDVRDTVRAYFAIALNGKPGRIYNVCSGKAFKIGEVLDQLVTLSKVRVTIRVDPERYRPSDNPILLGDRRRIERELGWSPRIPLEQTMSDLLDYWRKEIQ